MMGYFMGKNPWLSGEDFPNKTIPMNHHYP